MNPTEGTFCISCIKLPGQGEVWFWCGGVNVWLGGVTGECIGRPTSKVVSLNGRWWQIKYGKSTQTQEK